MTDQNNFHNNQTTFYNIDIYNDNSTGGDISSVFTTSFQSPSPPNDGIAYAAF